MASTGSKPALDKVAKAIDPAPWSGMVSDHDGNDLTASRKAAARSAARRVMALLPDCPSNPNNGNTR